jgi:hypothetical protein
MRTKGVIPNCRCPNPECNYAWTSRKPNPGKCPRCHQVMPPKNIPGYIPLNALEKKKQELFDQLDRTDEPYDRGRIQGQIDGLNWVMKKLI